MRLYKRIALVLLASGVLAVGAASAQTISESRSHVVSEIGIQTAIDAQRGQAEADRQSIREMLDRPEVRGAVSSAGLDIDRAVAAASLLSGAQLEELAAQARRVNSSLVGGESTFVLSATGLVIVLLVVILLLL